LHNPFFICLICENEEVEIKIDVCVYLPVILYGGKMCLMLRSDCWLGVFENGAEWNI
jgi:hypothetical protein